ncbi:sulfite exporter TauE/SafE family protein [Sinobacterium caligoides]|uniref:sulfite exporter TauE/SafE family protein n=1 Tax=Sinobacterium caligoides TaxID=933926 RepID=UPI0013C2C8E4|nr:sulfite exporter TauE/SafE family protein [Sinobacterium caligoides]
MIETIDLDVFASCIIIVAIFFSAIISSVTGMAGGVLMFSVMGLFMPLRPLVAVHGVVQIFNNAARCWLLRIEVCWAMCRPFCLGAVVGMTAATLFLVHYLSETLLLSLLLLLISYSVFKPKSMPQIKISHRHFFWLGIVTGIMAILIGVVDPLLGAFLLRDDLRKEQIVATKSLMQLFVHLGKVPAFIFLGFSFLEHWQLLLVFSLSAVVGTRIGVYILARIDPRVFFITMKAALLLAGFRVFYQLIVG